MKKIYILLLLSVLSFTSFSQLSFKIGPTIGATIPTGDYAGESFDFYAGDAYGMKTGINFGVLTKLSFGPINARASITYSSLKNEGLGDAGKPNSTVELNHKLLTIAIGPEFKFGLPAAPIKPYAGFDLIFTSISGDGRFNGTGGDAESSAFDLNSTTRTGIGVGIGAELSIVKLSLDIGLRYNMHNLFGKTYTAGTQKNDKYRYLNDDAGPAGGTITTSRSINTINLYLGVMFGF